MGTPETDRDRSPSSRSGFLIMDVVAAMAVMVMLVALFHTSLRHIRKLEILALTQNRAQVVLENVLERLEAEPVVTETLAREVLQAEFEASSLNIPDRFQTACDPHEQRLRLQVLRGDGRPVALVEIGP